MTVDAGAPIMAIESGVDALSILANKEQTKHFLERRIQADLSATASAPASPHLSSRMSPPGVPVALSPPVDFADDANGTGDDVAAAAPGEDQESDSVFRSGSEDDGELQDDAPEARITREIEELKRREEEIRRLHACAAANEKTAKQIRLDRPPQDPVPEPDGQYAAAVVDRTDYGSENAATEHIPRDVSGTHEAGRLRHSSDHSVAPSSGFGGSSGSHSPGLGSGVDCASTGGHQRATAATADAMGRREVKVRPLEDEDDSGTWTTFARCAETPIEREIRHAREREEERRREQALTTPATLSSSHGEHHHMTPHTGPLSRQQSQSQSHLAAADSRQMALRMAATRVQHEIEEATRRELELRQEGHRITTSEETLDDKVTWPISALDLRRELHEPAKQQSVEPPATTTNQDSSHVDHHSSTGTNAEGGPAQSSRTPSAGQPSGRVAAGRPPLLKKPPELSRRISAEQQLFRPAAGGGAGRGLMEKFISSRGRLRSMGAFVASVAPVRTPPKSYRGVRLSLDGDVRGAGEPAAANGKVTRTPAALNKYHRSVSLANGLSRSPMSGQARRAGSGQVESGQSAANNAARRVLTAEQKIQQELMQMKQREDELRRERTWALARSQPDLLAALDGQVDEDVSSASSEDEDNTAAPASARPHHQGNLIRTRSIPSLLDGHPLQTTELSTKGRRRSTLIDQWESRIQGSEV